MFSRITQRARSLSKLLQERSVGTLVLVEHDSKMVKAGTFSAITAASKLGGNITALVAGKDVSEIASKVASIDGVKAVLTAKGDAYANSLPEALAPLISRVVKAGNFTHVVAPATAFGKNVTPRVGALLDVQPISEVIAIQSPDTFVRPIYAGNALTTVQSSDSVKVMTVRTTAFPKAASSGSAAASISETPAGDDTPKGVKWLKEEVSTSERPELDSAKIVVSGGRGCGSKENFWKVTEMVSAALPGSAIGASRAAVDAGFAPNDLQIGQTGKVVAPELYLALGVSGAIQHIAGMKDAKTIVVVNKDAEAPFFQIADYGLVDDLNKAAPALVAALKK